MVIAVAPRLCTALGSATQLPLGPRVWRDTRVWLPANSGSGNFHDVFTGAVVKPVADGDPTSLSAAEVFAHLPAALLIRPQATSQ